MNEKCVIWLWGELHGVPVRSQQQQKKEKNNPVDDDQQ